MLETLRTLEDDEKHLEPVLEADDDLRAIRDLAVKEADIFRKVSSPIGQRSGPG